MRSTRITNMATLTLHKQLISYQTCQVLVIHVKVYVWNKTKGVKQPICQVSRRQVEVRLHLLPRRCYYKEQTPLGIDHVRYQCCCSWLQHRLYKLPDRNARPSWFLFRGSRFSEVLFHNRRGAFYKFLMIYIGIYLRQFYTILSFHFIQIFSNSNSNSSLTGPMQVYTDLEININFFVSQLSVRYTVI